jgi:hypothetical protein
MTAGYQVLQPAVPHAGMTHSLGLCDGTCHAEDVIPRLLLLAQGTVPSGAGAAAATALAEGSQAADALSQDKSVREQQQQQGQAQQAQHEQQQAQQHEQHLQGVESPSLKASTDTDSSSSVSPTRSGWLDGVRAAALLARRPLTATADAATGAARSALEGEREAQQQLVRVLAPMQKSSGLLAE